MGRKGITKSKVTQQSAAGTAKRQAAAKGAPDSQKTSSTNVLNSQRILQDTPVSERKGSVNNKTATSRVICKSEEKKREQINSPLAATGAVQSSSSNSESETAAQNEQKYLHKKFKRIASTSVEADGGPISGCAVLPESSEGGDRPCCDSESVLPFSSGPQSSSVVVVVVPNRTTEDPQTELRDVQCDSLTDTSSSAVLLREEGGQRRHIDDIQATATNTGCSTSEYGGAVSEGDNGDSLSSTAAGGGGVLSQNNNNNSSSIGRNVCHYCNLNCTKPSVLEKHIRSHTNERPYPCVPCGFAFKTKSNLYKHCRSRAHQLRAQGTDCPGGQGEEEGGGGAGQGPEDDISAGSEEDQELSNSGSSAISGSDEIRSRTASPVDDENMMGSAQQTDKPYKPKFHKAVLYNEQQEQQQQPQPPDHVVLRSVTLPCPNETLPFVPPVGTGGGGGGAGVSWSRGVGGGVAAEMHQQQIPIHRQQHQRISPAPIALSSTTSSPVPSSMSAMVVGPEMSRQGVSLNSNIPPRLSHLASQPYNLEQHISKLISRNEAIIEDVEPALQKKYHKITGKSRGNSLDFNSGGGTSKAQAAAFQQLQQFQANRMREESLTNQQQQQQLHLQHHHLMTSHHHHNQQQYNHLARRASTPAGISLPIPFSGMVGPTAGGATHMPMSANVQAMTPVKAGKTNKSPVSANQPLNLSKPTQATVLPATTPVKGSGGGGGAATNDAVVSSSAMATETPVQQLQQQHSTQQKAVHNVSSLTTLITNKLLKNTNIPHMKEFLENLRKQLSSTEGSSCATDINVSSHPQNPERSIIKGLLLDWKSVSNNGLEGTSSSAREGTSDMQSDESSYMCPVCKITFRNADTLQTHMKCYCQGNGLDKFSPTTLVNLARYKLRTTPRNHKTPSPLAKLAQSMLVPNSKSSSKPGNIVIPSPSAASVERPKVSYASPVECVMAPLPSPGPLLGKTRLVDTYPSTSSSVGGQQLGQEPSAYQVTSMAQSSYTQSRQMHIKAVPEPLILPMAHSSSSHRLTGMLDKGMMLPMSHSHSNLEMFGGELQLQPPKRNHLGEGGHGKGSSAQEEFKLNFSGGSIVSESPLSDSEQNPICIRTPGLFSGGKVERGSSSRNSPPITPLTPSLLVTPNQYTPSFMVAGSHFQFPPINPITAYNPLTLPAIPASLLMHSQHATGMKVYGDRLIPDVPGMPGPETMHLRMNPSSILHSSSLSANSNSQYSALNRSPSPLKGGQSARGVKRSSSASPVNVYQGTTNTLMAPPLTNGLLKTVKVESGEEKLRSPKERKTSRPVIWSPANLHSDNKKSFHFSRSEKEAKAVEDRSSIELAKASLVGRQQLHVDVDMVAVPDTNKVTTPKFLRPSSLSLEPGTFTPKRHHGITPTANTLPLISPETPRPSKSCVQLYINGQAYTYLGLKCSTKPFYCTVNKTQPIYLPHHTISMYSQWQVCAESSPHPLGLKPGAVIGLYDSRQNQSSYSSATISVGASLKHSQGPIMTPFETQRNHSLHHHVARCPTPPQTVVAVQPPATEKHPSSAEPMELVEKRLPPVPSAAEDDQKKDASTIPVSVFGGYESNEDYEYIKGRGYGRFVCETCGIRCRKPSMLKKHIRTHTNIRPFTCQYCCFSFKTKGNLTKHMKSKSHAKKCEELGVSPLPTAEDMMEDSGARSLNASRGMTVIPGDSDSEDDSDGDDQSEGSDTEDIKARLQEQEQEAARGLLSLSMTPPTIMSQAVDTYRSVPHTIDRLGEDLSVKCQARPEFAVQKITFEFPRPEQYYSNPNIAKPATVSSTVDETDDGDLPMDLTKPRRRDVERKAVTFTQIMEPAGLISSLVSITDKIPAMGSVGSAGLNETALLQQYITERAMHETKMKQQQKKRDYRPPSAKSEAEESNASMLHQYLSEPKIEKVEVDEEESQAVTPCREEVPAVPQTLPLAVMETKPEPLASSMDTLADIAANSTKLGLQPASVSTNESAATDQRNTTAKFVASEYLKMATQRHSVTLKSSDREDGESSSDQEMVSSEGNRRKRTDSVSEVLPRTVVVVKDSPKNAEFANVANAQPCRIPPPADDGRSVCEVCRKTFQKPSQLKLHMNIHYLERKFRCEPCGVSFRTQGHLHKHERSLSHHNKVSMTSTFGVATTVNPRPFNCTDCRVAFRIHGHLAKHLRSKMHVLRLECLCKIPFGTYAEIERAGINLTNIDTKDCDTFLASLKALARQLPELSVHATDSIKQTAAAAASGEESENEDSEHMMGNGYADDRQKNGGGESSTLKRKFGTLLNGNETMTDDDQSDQQDGAGDVPNGAIGGGSQADVSSGNSNDGAKDYESSAAAASVEKRIKVN